MKNHLLIGLGGTGGKILRSLRKGVFQEFRKNDSASVNLRYLYVDSSREMMALDDSTWKTLGESVQLDKRSQLLIQGGDLDYILSNLDTFPNIKPWIGSRDQWQDILNSIVGETLGGQKRRLGRFLFACKAQEFKNQLIQLVAEMTNGGESAVTFHVCAGLAGGTGSGSLIDVISQVRALYREPRTYRIVPYLLMPDEQPPQNWNTGNYHANGYVALKELNALGVSALRPHDVSGRGERLDLSDPFNGCYLFMNRNENGLQVDVDKDLPTVVADFLFQKIIAIRGGEALKLLEKMENAENGDGTPEKRPGTNLPERSKRFMAFGIKRLAIPEMEIREYLTYKFAQQAGLQLRFNHWDDSRGFLKEPRRVDFGELVRQRETQERWLMSDEHLQLSRGILPEEINNKKWKPVNQEWMDVMPQLATMAEQNQPANAWLNNLEKLAAQRFEETFRGLGVRRFYETKLAACRDHAREIGARIERELFDEWKNGVRSMYDVGRLYDALVVSLEERLAGIDSKITKQKENAELSEKKVQANRTEYAHTGVLAAAFGKRKSLLNAQTECLRDVYIYRTLIEAWGFAKVLLQALVAEITGRSSDVHNGSTLIDESITEFETRFAGRCNDKEEPDLRQSLVRYYNPDRVKAFAKLLDKDKSEQVRQAQGVRLALISQLGGDPDFGKFARLSRERFLDLMERQSEASARKAHDAAVTLNRDLNPLFGMNIVGRLEQEFSGKNEELKQFIHDLVGRAGYFLEFDNQQVIGAAAGTAGGAPTRVQQCMVIIPKAQEHASFGQSLRDVIKQQFPGGVPVEFIEGNKPNEITFIGLTNLFPLRYAKILRVLHQKYEQRLKESDNPARVKLETHCEGDGSQLPELFIPDRSEILTRTSPFFLLAKPLSLVQAVTNPGTGETALYLVETDEDGFDRRTKLGRNFSDVFETIDIMTAQRLEEGVSKALALPENRHQEKRKAMQNELHEQLRLVLAERGGNFEDRTYKEVEAAARKAIQILKPN
jgi:hypothetical protein